MNTEEALRVSHTAKGPVVLRVLSSSSVLLYVHRNHKDYCIRDRELRTATSTFTRLLSSAVLSIALPPLQSSVRYKRTFTTSELEY